MTVLHTTSKLLYRRMRVSQRPPMLAPAVLRGRRIAPHYLWLLQRQLLSTPLLWPEQARNDCESRMKESRKQGLALVLERTLYLHRLGLWTGSSSRSGVLLVDLRRVWASRLRRQRNRLARDTFFKYFPIFFCFHESWFPFLSIDLVLTSLVPLSNTATYYAPWAQSLCNVLDIPRMSASHICLFTRVFR
jgi:hypothetical protein